MNATLSARRRSRLVPIAAGAVAYGVLLIGWHFVLAPRLPEQVNPVDGHAHLGPSERIGMLMGSMGWRETEVLIAGDSRVGRLFVDLIEDEVGRSCGILWGGGVEVLDLLEHERQVAPRILLLALSPMSVHHARPEQTNVLEEVPQEFADVETLTAWLENVREDFLELGVPEDEVTRVLGGMFTVESRKIERRKLSPAEIDRRLADWVDSWRFRQTRVLSTASWASSWFEIPEPAASDDRYVQSLRGSTRAAREEKARTISEQLKGLAERGWTVVTFQMPVSPSLHAIEEEAFPSKRIRELADTAGVPFFDYAGQDYGSADGSHLTVTSSLRFSRRLGRELRALLDDHPGN